MKKTHIVIALSVGLLLSLAANVYFGGVSLGRMMSPPASCDRKEWREKETVLKERLSPADYDGLMAHKKAKKKEFRTEREALRKARVAVDHAMQAQDFDSAALKKALEAEHQVKLQALQRMREARDKLSAELSPQGREVFADVMRRFSPEGTPEDAPPPPRD